MFDDTILNPSERLRLRGTLLAGLIREYFDELASKGYAAATFRWYGLKLLRFSEFLDQRRVNDVRSVASWTKPFLDSIQPSATQSKIWRSAIRRFVAYLSRTGHVPPVDAQGPAGPFIEVIAGYIQFLRDHRGVCPEAAVNIRSFCSAFAVHLTDHGLSDLHSLSPAVIHEFLTLDGGRYSRKTMSGRCSALRGFLRHLFRRDITRTDLSPVVVAPRLYKHEKCPRYIPESQIRSVLSAVDRTTRVGRRDYAMILLLATYGLRGIEVIRLTLGDIDWRNNRLRIGGRKAGNTTFYPLASDVGEAILTYLRDHRPCSSSRRVFLSIKAPFPPLACTSALGIQVRRYFNQAGVQIDRPGTHTFRYSCAQRLLGRATPLKTIGDFLGHRDPNSTRRYTKIAIEQLRGVALSGEEVLR